ncbi:oligosaccharide flippase family protein [Roseomonas sp. HF4]|uniref:oligosaccharide flippase family protein n=1 Tax=Roseomonas sp. HF4 TaxID=2562313 RepID=UPI001484E57F|nr:oligosaccharide flippase family protein [Roseomonas sp. HF4]
MIAPKPRMAAPAARKVALGVMVLSGANAFRLVIQFLLFPVLARLLSPAEFGLVALAMPVVFVVMTMGEGGMVPAVVRAPDPLGQVEATMFWVALANGTVLALLLMAAAPWIAAALSHEEIAPILRWLAPTLVLGALCSVPSARVQKGGATWIFAVGEVAATVAGAAAALHGALDGWGAWSLVAQQLVLWTVKAVVLLSLAGARARARPGRRAFGYLVRHGAPMLGTNLLALVSRSADCVIVGRLLGVEPLGLYALAVQIVRIPEAVLVGPVFVSLLPAIVRLDADRPAAARLFATALRMMLTFAAPMMLGLAVVADLAVAILLGPRWAGTTSVLMLLAPAAMAQAVGWLSMAVLLGRGRSGLQFRVALLGTALTLAGLLAGAAHGLAGVAAGIAVATFAGGGAYLVAAMRELRLSPGALAAATWPPLVAAMVMAGGVIVLRRLLPPSLDALPAIAVTIPGGVLLYLGALVVLAPATLAADLRRFRRRASPQGG